MIQRILLLTFVTCGILFSQVPVKEKEHLFSGKFAITTETGLSLATMDYSKNKPDYIGRGAFEYFFPTTSAGAFGLRVMGSGGYYAGKEPKNGDAKYNPYEYRAQFFSGEAGIVYALSLWDFVFPYAYTGVSYFNFKVKDNNDNELTKSSNYKTSEIQYTGEVGLRFQLAQNLSLNMNSHLNFSTKDNLDNLPHGSNDMLPTANVGLTFYFGGKKDSDGDGIVDADDKCPNQPEDFDGFQDEDGCPDPDNDNDGILDINDKCPNQPEDFDGFQDDDGCPDPDNDNDGILDINDKCPNQPEDFDGFQDEDGCPDPDNDNDGILDIYDKCPNIPEDYNGVKDDDGCPENEVKTKTDTVYVTKTVFTTKNVSPTFVIPAKALFANTKADFIPTAGLQLDTLVNVFREFSDTRWRIECHTDNANKTAKKLAQQRATAIMQYFTGRGIAKNRFQIFGVGPDLPIGDNKTPSGKDANNRILLIRIK